MDRPEYLNGAATLSSLTGLALGSYFPKSPFNTLVGLVFC